ncbi:GAF domain-containing sensor histidine kinase [Nostoc sp.]|uniref:GAF domain-containing sensor histidine kinase n=1 Tax=Nostoc sp. TaxID=1180 RepID=UPI002FF6E516
MVLQPQKSLEKGSSQSVKLSQIEARVKAAESHKIVAITVEKIRQSLDLEYIFQTTTQEIKQLLNSDRVVLYRFNPDWSGTFVAESLAQGWLPLIQQQVHQPELVENVSECNLKNLSIPPIVDTYLKDTQGGRFSKNETYRVCHDVYSAGFSKCYLKILERCQARAYVITAIYQSQQLWGLLAVYQNDGPREWQTDEVYILTQIASQLGVALQQAELLKQTRSQKEELATTLKDLQQAQAQLVQSEKMASLGQLVAGIAHEINNPVSFIYGNLKPADEYTQNLFSLLDLYQRHYPQSVQAIEEFANLIELDFLRSDFPKLFKSMIMGAERIREIVLSLRTFSRLDEAEMKAVDIHEGIDSTMMLVQNRLKPTNQRPQIEVIKEYSNLPLIECYAGQLNQVFLNILVNAIDALEDSVLKGRWATHKQLKMDNPRIYIRTQLLTPNQVTIHIGDNGLGIPEDALKQIFNPFFTTKPVGQGTGMGLAISYQIITQRHGGSLECISQPGVGAEFIIRIPLIQQGIDAPHSISILGNNA